MKKPLQFALLSFATSTLWAGAANVSDEQAMQLAENILGTLTLEEKVDRKSVV